MDNNKKPLILELEEAKNELIQCVNHIIQARQLPCYFLVPIVESIYREIQSGAQNELATAMKQTMIKADEVE